jgi:hypothetical protein
VSAPVFFGPRAFGGGQLQGDRLVRLVYVDEAGITNRRHEPFLIVAGVIVDADMKLVAIERHLTRLVDRHIPEQHRDGFVFHAMELFNGGGKVFVRPEPGDPNPEWPLERRLAIADDLAAIPRKFDLPLAFGIVERAKWPQTFTPPANFSEKDRTIGEHVTAFMACALVSSTGCVTRCQVRSALWWLRITTRPEHSSAKRNPQIKTRASLRNWTKGSESICR